MYVIICTRPDSSYAFIVTSRYHSDLGEGQWVVVKNILKYLRRTKAVFFINGDENLLVSRYTDAIFQFDRDDSKSQSGYVFTLNGGVDSWKCFKQKMTANSTTEAKYIVDSKAAKEVV